MDPQRHPALTHGSTRLSVVIPTLNEARALPRLLGELQQLGPDTEIIVTDGGSTDGTVAAAVDADIVVEGPPGRGGQLNRGAEAASAPILFFIHADSGFTAEARDALEAWLGDRRSRHEAAVFRFALAAQGPGWRILEWGQAIRHRVFGIAFGDQGLVLPRSLYRAVGGFPDIPVMEDAAMTKSLRRLGSVHTLPATLLTSARRYQRQGRIRSVVRNQILLLLHTLGVPPRKLAGSYTPELNAPPLSAPDRRSLVVFAKAPIAGGVKTRLAADVGPEAAARLYRTMGHQVVTQVSTGPWDTEVWYAPRGREREVRAWLGDERRYHPQPEGDLGERMDAAIRNALQASDAACVVGTDAPDVTAAVVQSAFDALAHYDVVLGPAQDGGYYLIGMKRAHSPLFQGVSWSTGSVLDQTLERAESEGLRVHLLPVLRDVDHLQDVPNSLLGTLRP